MLLIAAAGAKADYATADVGWTDFLQAKGFTGDLTELYVLRSHRVFQVSSYDRTGGNEDNAYYIEKTEDGMVLADLPGPGAILRIWSPQPAGVLRFYIDGEPWPRFSWPFEAVFDGRLVPFRSPLVDSHSGGFYSYVPIPYVKSCRVVLAGYEGKLYYQVTACQFDDASDLVSFEPDLLTRSDRSYFRHVKRSWDRPGWFGSRLNLRHLTDRKRVLWPRDVLDIAKIEGPAVVEGVWLELESRDPRCAENVALEAYWDGETDPSVVAVVSDFFGTRYTGADFRSIPIGNRDGQMYCYLPMPFRTKARIALRNFSGEKVIARSWVSWRPVDSLPANTGMFHAQSRMTTAESGVPISILEAQGHGQYVGCVMNAESSESLDFLEGDEQIFVDGESEPSMHGTGTEDYFNGGWYFQGKPFATATHGATVVGGTEPGEQVTAYRFHLTDYIPFRESFRMQIEHGGTNNAPNTQYYTTAFWYQAEPHQPLWESSSVPKQPEPEPRSIRLIERHKTPRELKADRARKSAQEEQTPVQIEIAPTPVQSVTSTGSQL